nr:MAG TPA: hypothetical protein [Caudoviricetes sp.]
MHLLAFSLGLLYNKGYMKHTNPCCFVSTFRTGGL